MIPLFWVVIYLVMAGLPANPTTMGPINDEKECKDVKRQLVELLHPKIIGCVEVPTFRPQ